MPKVGGLKPDGVQAVVLTLRILEHLARSGRDVGVTAIASALGTTKSRIFRHLQTLVAQGYAARSPDTDRYRVGSHLVALGLAVSGGLDVATAATPVVRRLREALGHSVVVSGLETGGMRVLLMVPGISAIEIAVRSGSILPFHATAQGKIGLAFGPESLRRGVFRCRLAPMTPRTLIRVAALRANIEMVRTNGWAVAPNESILGVNVLAAPILGRGGECLGAIGIIDSIQFIDEVPSPKQTREIVGAAREISAALGFSPDDHDSEASG